MVQLDQPVVNNLACPGPFSFSFPDDALRLEEDDHQVGLEEVNHYDEVQWYQPRKRPSVMVPEVVAKKPRDGMGNVSDLFGSVESTIDSSGADDYLSLLAFSGYDHQFSNENDDMLSFT